jgi:4-hydroxy-4-methyl-2-oxoglutarate aldolase
MIGLRLPFGAPLPSPPCPPDRAPDALIAAMMGDFAVTTADFVVADDDGALFIPAESLADIVAAAEAIRDGERQQADRIRTGQTLRDQLRFGSYLAARAVNPDLTFRKHLRSVGGAIEE